MNEILAAVLVPAPDEAILLHLCLAQASEQHKTSGVYVFNIPEHVSVQAPDPEILQQLITSAPEICIPEIALKHSKKQKNIVPQNSQKQILHTNHKIRASIIRNYKQRKK